MDEFYFYLPGILLSLSVFAVGIFSPGPNILAIIGTSMASGRESGTALALGVATGSFFWGLLSAIGLTALLASYAFLLGIIKIVGGIYLLWLAYKSFRAASAKYDIAATTLTGKIFTPSGFYRRGLLIQMTNPKAALSWIAIITLGLQPGAPIWVAAVIVVGLAIFSVITHCLYALAFSTPMMVGVYSRARRWIQATLGVFFTFAGLKLLTSR